MPWLVFAFIWRRKKFKILNSILPLVAFTTLVHCPIAGPIYSKSLRLRHNLLRLSSRQLVVVSRHENIEQKRSLTSTYFHYISYYWTVDHSIKLLNCHVSFAYVHTLQIYDVTLYIIRSHIEICRDSPQISANKLVMDQNVIFLGYENRRWDGHRVSYIAPRDGAPMER